MDSRDQAPLTIAVFEARPRWAPELDRQFLDEDVQIRAVRRTRELLDAIEPGAAGLLVLDLEADPAACLVFLGRMHALGTGIPALVVVDREAGDLEWAVRELGATSVVDEYVPGHVLAATCRRMYHGGRPPSS